MGTIIIKKCHDVKVNLSFLKDWNVLTKYFDQNNISYNKYEDSINADIIKKKNINSFPTILYENNGIDYAHKGDRSINSIINNISDIQSNQYGGNNIKRYKINYIL